MDFNHRSGGTWQTGTPKVRRSGSWVEFGAEEEPPAGEFTPAGYAWDDTFTDYSWLTNSDANETLNVETVTNLNASGTGSLDDAVNNASSYPTVVVFEIGGVIDLAGSNITCTPSGGVWIAGETAPDPGISIIRGALRIETEQFIVSHIGVYSGDDVSSERDSITIDNTTGEAHIILDHVTAMWGTDECMGFSDPIDNSSILNCIIAEGLFDSIHPEGTHSRGMLFNNECVDVVVAGNLYAHNNRRHPLNRADAFVVNQYIYNWGGGCIHMDNAHPTFTSIGHYCEDGVNTSSNSDRPIHRYSADLYYDDIHVDGIDRLIVDPAITVLGSPPVVPPGVDIATDLLAAADVKDWAMGQAGMRPASRPQVDADLINNRVGDGAGSRIDSQTEVGGYPDYSSTSRSLSVPSTGIVDWIQTNHTAVVEGTATAEPEPEPATLDQYTWDQSHTNTGWVDTADANDNWTVETVTNLNATGPGSFDQALADAGGNTNTLIVFEVGGVIDWNSANASNVIRPSANNVYIAGQTAPYPGITVIRGGIRIEGDNVVMEHISFLPGDDIVDPHAARAITYHQNTSDILVNHCTAGWAPDTNVNMRDATTRASFINSINAEALNMSSHPEAPHGYGWLIRAGAGPVSYLGNLSAHNWKRNIKPNENCDLAVANVHFYNWGDRVWHGSDSTSEADWIGTIVEAGADTAGTGQGIFDEAPGVVYFDDNTLIPSNQSLQDGSITYVGSPQHLPAGLPEGDIRSAADLEDFLTPMLGPRPADRPPVEARIIDDYTNRTGGIIDTEADVGGYPAYTSTSRSLSPPSTNVLDWLADYTAEVEVGTTNPNH